MTRIYVVPAIMLLLMGYGFFSLLFDVGEYLAPHKQCFVSGPIKCSNQIYFFEGNCTNAVDFCDKVG